MKAAEDQGIAPASQGGLPTLAQRRELRSGRGKGFRDEGLEEGARRDRGAVASRAPGLPVHGREIVMVLLAMRLEPEVGTRP